MKSVLFTEFLKNYIKFMENEYNKETDAETVMNDIKENDGVLSLAYSTSEFRENCEIQVNYNFKQERLIVKLSGSIDKIIYHDIALEKLENELDWAGLIWYGENYILENKLDNL